MKYGIIILLISGIMGCSGQYATNNADSFLSSHNGPALNMPSPLQGNNISSFYILPSQRQNARISIDPPENS